MTFDTEGTIGIDTEIYDADGILLGNNDDGGTGWLSSMSLDDFEAVTYCVANVSAFTAVPEPATASLLGLSFLGLSVIRRPRR